MGCMEVPFHHQDVSGQTAGPSAVKIQNICIIYRPGVGIPIILDRMELEANRSATSA